jgi:hypothetical protein
MAEIGMGTADIGADGNFIITLPPYSITHLVIEKM